MGTGANASLVLWPMAVVLALLVVAALLARRFRQQRMPGCDNAAIEILASRRLGLQVSLLLVQVDGRKFLLAATRSGIVPLAPVESGPERDRRG
ncbi:flagellar biosynthetic protein FliO [Acidisoma silvae]|uniref:Flagellar biosynthetic protein FliO n=1 Tax=Acidisoma silvae TaxID=2802396 RepID=A0A963YQQ4_9PROT|nr:flagellar biosynthetic protein FliO [Acidisoma silvae]MCB8874899.1 flagellar biosynthetic protein FliO [Acidisoma silvae]